MSGRVEQPYHFSIVHVRQLANEMRRLAALAETDAVLMPGHLSAPIVAGRRTVPAFARPIESNEIVVRLDQPMAAATEHLERAIIPWAFRRSGGRMGEAARMLGLSRKGLYLKRQRLGLEPPEQHIRAAWEASSHRPDQSANAGLDGDAHRQRLPPILPAALARSAVQCGATISAYHCALVFQRSPKTAAVGSCLLSG